MSKSIPVKVKYKLGHTYDETFEHQPELYCPHCAKKGVYRERGPGDYYSGSQDICVWCGYTWDEVNPQPGDDHEDLQRLAQLRAALEHPCA